MAAAPPTSSAVAGRVFSWQELLDIAARQQFVQPIRRNNHALKYYRHLGEEPTGVLRDAEGVVLQLDLDAVLCLKDIQHDAQGPGFSFDAPALAGRFVNWSPAQFVTHLRDDYVGTMGLQTHGVWRLEVAGLPGAVDTHRSVAAKQLGQAFGRGVRPPLWDFIITGGDGVQWALHPPWRSKGKSLHMAELTPEVLEARKRAVHCKVRDWEHQVYQLAPGRLRQKLAARGSVGTGSSAVAGPRSSGASASSAPAAPGAASASAPAPPLALSAPPRLPPPEPADAEDTLRSTYEQLGGDSRWMHAVP